MNLPSNSIITVTGQIPPEELGFCQCHEHLLIAPGRSGEIDPALCFHDIARSAQEACRYRAAGGSSLVDAQPVGCGRMASGLLEISRQAGIFLVASTGFHKMRFYPEEHWIFSASSSQLRDLFIHELETGMYVDGDSHFPDSFIPARAGIIKTALDSCGLTPQYEKLFTAAAAASQETGIHLELARAGCYLEYDTIGRFKYHSDDEEILYFQLLKEQNLLSQLLFSLDTTRLRLKAYSGPEAVGLDYILLVFLPLLEKAGFTSAEIRQISVLNPRKALARRQPA